MTITLQDISRNASVNARTALAAGGVLRLKQGSTTICNITLPATAFNAAASGSATARGGDGSNAIGAGNPLTGTTIAAAETGIDGYEVRTSGDALAWAGTSDELTLSTAIIGSGGSIQITGWTHSQAA